MPTETRIIAFASGKGGAGKTTMAVNIGLALASMNQKVCLLDADLGLSNVDLLLGLEPPKYTLEDVLFNNVSMEKVLVHAGTNLDIIPGSSGISRMAELPQHTRRSLVDEFQKLEGYNYLLIDNSPGLSSQVVSLCLSAREIIVVVNPEVTSLVDAYALIKILRENGMWTKPAILVNRVERLADAKQVFSTLCVTVKKFLDMQCSWLGAVPLDVRARTGFNNAPIFRSHPQSPAGRCIRFVAERLLHDETKGWKKVKPGEFWESSLTRIKQRPRFDLDIPSGEPRDADILSWAEMTPADLSRELNQRAREMESICEHLSEIPGQRNAREEMNTLLRAVHALTAPIDLVAGEHQRGETRCKDVLVVSNQQEMRQVLQDMLILLGHKARCVVPGEGGGAEGSDIPWLILVSCDRPLKKIHRTMALIPDVPVVFLGRFGHTEMLKKYADRIAAVIPPPVGLASLQSVLERLA